MLLAFYIRRGGPVPVPADSSCVNRTLECGSLASEEQQHPAGAAAPFGAA